MLDEFLTWSSHLSMLKSRAIGILEKLSYYASNKLLANMYKALFESHKRYGFQFRRQTRNQHVSDVKLQKKMLRIINVSDKCTSTKSLFNELRTLSVDEIVNLQNCLLVLNVLNNEVPEALQKIFKNITNQHHCDTSVINHNNLNLF